MTCALITSDALDFVGVCVMVTDMVGNVRGSKRFVLLQVACSFVYLLNL